MNDERPFPPGDYPLVVVGTGPGGLQLSYDLRALGIEHALISKDSRPGGMFRPVPDVRPSDHVLAAARDRRVWLRLFHKGDGPEIVCDRAPSARVRVETNQSRASRGGPQELS